MLMDFLWRVVLSTNERATAARFPAGESTPGNIEGITAKDLPKPSRAKPPHHGRTVQTIVCSWIFFGGWFYRQTIEPRPQPSPAFDNCRTVPSWSTSPPETIENKATTPRPETSGKHAAATIESKHQSDRRNHRGQTPKRPHHGRTVQSSCPDHSSDRTTGAKLEQPPHGSQLENQRPETSGDHAAATIESKATPRPRTVQSWSTSPPETIESDRITAAKLMPGSINPNEKSQI